MQNTDLFNFRKLTEPEIKRYHEQGYLLLPSTLTDDGVDLLRQSCMQAWQDEKKSYDPSGTWLKNALLVNIHHKSELARDFYFRGPLVDMMQQLIGINIKGVTSQLTFKMMGNIKTFGWHQDNGYGELSPYNAISTLTALEDVDEDNGCLRLIPGSHKEGQIDVKKIKSEGQTIELDIDDALGVPMPMRAGDTLIFDCAMLHQSQGNHSKTRHRRILFLRYADADAVEVYNEGRPRLGKLLKGESIFQEVTDFEKDL